MTEAAPASSTGAASAGAALRQARQAQGLHIAALAAALKVSPKKLEALENDRHDELPDATFVRALALSVCRHLKIDADPVLALLPSAGQPVRLEHVTRGLNTPFRERADVGDTADASWLANPALWAIAALLVAASAFFWWPSSGTLAAAWQSLRQALPGIGASAPGMASASGPADGPAAPATSVSGSPVPADTAAPAAAGTAPAGASAPAPAAVIETVHSAPAAAPGASADLPAGVLVLRTSAESWIEVRDAGYNILLSRLLAPGEAIGLNGALPLRLKVGNAEGTEVLFRGQAVQLAPFTRDNVSRLELK